MLQRFGRNNPGRRIGSICCVLTVLLIAFLPATAAADAIGVHIDGRLQSFDAPPRVVQGRTLVPMRAIFEALGAEVQWDAATQTVTASRGATTIALTLSRAEARVDAMTVRLDVPARIIDGRTFVPLRFVGEALGADVVWDAAARTVRITSAAASQPSAPPAGQPDPPAPPSQLPPGDLRAAQQLYPPHAAEYVLGSRLADLGDVYACIEKHIGSARLTALRAGATSTGVEKDVAALCLLQADVPPAQVLPAAGPMPGPQPGHQPGPPGTRPVTVEYVQSNYKAAPGGTTGFFKTGQAADILLSGFDFNNTGGPLLFNHPSGLASDGTRLIMADTFNNRVLIWHQAPTGNVPPDLVLGQKDFTSNDPGRGLDQMNWPFAVATDGERLVVTDVMNDRVLVWNSFPSQNGAPADVVLGTDPASQLWPDSDVLVGPWGAWTDGERLVVTNTWGQGAKVWIWNSFPTADYQEPDLRLTGGGHIGTPRHVTSDGRALIIGDHNARVAGASDHGSFVWLTFPSASDQPYDYYLPVGYGWPRGVFTADGKLILMGGTDHGLQIWNSMPQTAAAIPTQTVQHNLVNMFSAGDYEHLAMVGERLYISLGNGNRVVGYHSVPTRVDQLPDFAVGSPDIDTNTLDDHFFIQNGVPASNGRSLFVSSDYDKKLYVWKNLPDESGAYPDLVYDLGGAAPWDNALWGDRLVLAGREVVMIWESLPLDGQQPDRIFVDSIGSVKFQELKGVALDDRYFYLGDAGAGKLYVWEGIPDADSEPKLVFDVDNPWMLSSDGTYLAVAAAFDHAALVFRVDSLTADSQPAWVGGPNRANGVPGVAVAGGHLFVADGWNRIFVWRDVEAAIEGQWPPDVVLGEDDLEDKVPEIGRSKIFSPRALNFDGDYLWVGEVKFSNRMLRFSPAP